MQRYFVKKVNQEFQLQESDFHHIKDVMRIKENGEIICVCEEKSFLCHIHYISHSYKIEIIKEITQDTELSKKVILYQALIKNDKMDFVIQKATELGMSDLYPTVFARSVIKIEKNKEESKISRYEKIVKEACEQSHRQVLPTIHPYLAIKDIILDENTLGLMAYENNDLKNSFSLALKDIICYDKIAIIIGPEGGFSEEEVYLLTQKGFRSISLGKRILRSETAALYALSVIAYHLEGM